MSAMGSHHPPPADDAEADLVDRLKRNDAAAWAELYDRYADRVWRYAAARTGSRDAADDIAAQVFLEALQAIERYRPTGKPILAWLYGIARHHAAKWRHRQGREAAPLPDDALPEGDAAPEGAVLDSILVSGAIGRLTKEQRDVIALRYYAGHSTAEIAAILGKREAAVYSLEARALASLRRHLATEAENLTTKADEIRATPGI